MPSQESSSNEYSELYKSKNKQITPSDKLSIDQNYNIGGYQRSHQPVSTPQSYADYSRFNAPHTPINAQQQQLNRGDSRSRVRPSPDNNKIKWEAKKTGITLWN